MLSSIQIPEELANRLKPLGDRIPQIIELGLRRFNATEQTTFEGADEVLEFLASLPEPKHILQLRPSEKFQTRISRLKEKNRETGLSPQEEIEWEHYQYLEHLIRIAKAKAYLKLNKGEH